MLTVRYEDNGVLKPLYKKLGLSEEPFGTNFVMYDEAESVAVWRMRLDTDGEPVGIIDRIAFADTVDEQDRLFFVHTVFFKLIEGAPLRLRMIGVHRELERFGFCETDGNMEIFSKNINLHYMCRG